MGSINGFNLVGSQITYSGDPGFSREGANSKDEGTNQLFGQISSKTVWKWKTLDGEGVCIPGAPLDPLLR